MGCCCWAGEFGLKPRKEGRGGGGEVESNRADSRFGVFVVQVDGWVSVFGQTTNGTWIEVVQEQIQLESPTHVLFV